MCPVDSTIIHIALIVASNRHFHISHLLPCPAPHYFASIHLTTTRYATLCSLRPAMVFSSTASLLAVPRLASTRSFSSVCSCLASTDPLFPSLALFVTPRPWRITLWWLLAPSLMIPACWTYPSSLSQLSDSPSQLELAS